MKKLSALILLLTLLASISLTGCTGTEVRGYEPTEAPDAEETNEAVQTPEPVSYHAAFEAYGADEVVMTINGLDVTWAEYFYWMVSNVNYIENYIGEITDWDAECALDPAQTNREYIMSFALDAITQYRALEYNAQLMDAELSDEDVSALNEQWLSDVSSYGGGDEAVFVEYLESLYISKDIYDYMNRISMLYYSTFKSAYGENGELCGDEQVREFAEANNYIAAKHILVSTVDAEGAALPEDELAAKLALAEDILAELEAAEDLNAKFDELMNEYSEDPGLLYYPEGYIFTKGEMAAEFEETSFALEPGEVSGLVETTFGYHIILRIPLNYDGVIEYYSADEKYTLRYTAASSLFAAMVDSWVVEAAEMVVWTPDFENFDIAEVFARAR